MHLAEEALDDLYLGDFDGFVARRDELAKQLRERGEVEAASRIRALKKPSRVAWAVNRLSGREPALRDELLGAGEGLRRAQEQILAGKAEGADLRAVSERERAAVEGALVAIARDAGDELSAAALERARQTLHAVALDEEVRREFEARRLTKDHEAAGLVVGAVPAGRRRTAPRAEKREELKAAEAQARKLDRRREAAQRTVEDAREAVERAQRKLSQATAELDEASAEAKAARRRLKRLRK